MEIEKMFIHESTDQNLNPSSNYEREFTYPNGNTFVIRNYAGPKDLACELHYIYLVAGKTRYVIHIVPSIWLNDAEYLQKMHNGYLVKIVHESDMSENS
jgi:hypothetical protein